MIFDIKLHALMGPYDWRIEFDQAEIDTPEKRQLFITAVKQLQHSVSGTAVIMLDDPDCMKLAEECGFKFQQKAWGGMSIYAYR